MSKSSELDRACKLYILDCIKEHPNTGDLMSVKDSLEHVNSRFTKEYQWRINQVGAQTAMIDWLQGLALPIEYRNYKILELAINWGSITKDSNDKEQDKILNNYWRFMACKLLQLINNYRVPKL